MERKISDSRGFTLIELVTVIIIAAILSAIAGMGLVQIANGYVFARKNAAVSQQAQVALARLVKELSEMRSVPSATATGLTYQRINAATGLPETHTLSWVTENDDPEFQHTLTIRPATEDQASFTWDYFIRGGEVLPRK